MKKYKNIFSVFCSFCFSSNLNKLPLEASMPSNPHLLLCFSLKLRLSALSAPAGRFWVSSQREEERQEVGAEPKEVIKLPEYWCWSCVAAPLRDSSAAWVWRRWQLWLINAAKCFANVARDGARRRAFSEQRAGPTCPPAETCQRWWMRFWWKKFKLNL